ncbi:MAG TPA: signal recognition particle protein [Bacteroidetes bacterium]|nr:signal recognition particle protein [Bacteroidota bacterium]HDZ11602.1 signal recognition particle protein [Bacteroidota bacterium]
MFEDLTRKLDHVLKKIKGQGKLSEKNIADSLREVRKVLLEADVNYKVAKEFVKSVQEKSLGQAVLKSITPGQQIVKIIYDELTRLMGQSTASLRFANIPPTIFMATGLQGSGKTTFVGKLALYLRGQKHSPLMVAADIYRPAAIDQLKTIGKQLNIPVFSEDGKNPIQICWDSIQQARQNGNDVVIFDTAGRLHIDENMMKELSEIKEKTKPHNIFFVADGMTGQDAVKAATEFNNWLAYDGVVLTKMDGDARGGAALSIKAVTGKPIMFVGMGEKFNTLEQFHPDRMASRILGMGDVISLVEKAQIAVSEEESRRMEEAIRKKRLTFDDFLQQLRQIKKMGPLEQIIGMIPGLGASPLGKTNVDEKALVKVEAIIQSMTREERRNPRLLNGNRKRRIARGSGTTVQDVNRLISQFNQMQKLMKRFSKGGKRSMRGVLGGNYPF